MKAFYRQNYKSIWLFLTLFVMTGLMIVFIFSMASTDENEQSNMEYTTVEHFDYPEYSSFFEEDLDSNSLVLEDAIHKEWILKWKEGFARPEEVDFAILDVDYRRNLLLVSLEDGVNDKEWYEEWMQRADIDYIEPNQSVRPNTIDAEQVSDSGNSVDFVSQINAQDLVFEDDEINREVTVAVIDTGVDLNHPDLRDHLVPGKYIPTQAALSKYAQSRIETTTAQDQNGHGTEIAGVLVMAGIPQENRISALRSINVMPIRVMDDDEHIDLHSTTQGIYAAIDAGVDIMVMSLVNGVFTRTLQDAVAVAEEKGILIVAATGNSGHPAVLYPAAFPSVFAIGAVDDNDEPTSYTNYGPEVNVVAPGSVNTISLDGDVVFRAGTSISTPQVGMLAALILKKYPDLTPAQVRNHIMYTAQDISEEGWDQKTGYGRIDVANAIETPPVVDIYQTNDSLADAAILPIDNRIHSELRNKRDQHFFYFDAPEDGSIDLDVFLTIGKQKGVDIIYYPNMNEEDAITYTVKKSKVIELEVSAGASAFKLQFNESEHRTTPVPYYITGTFAIYDDAQQPNNSREEATEILLGEGRIFTGTLNRDGLEDWYYFDVPEEGRIEINITVNNILVDPAFTLERPDGSTQYVDDGWLNGPSSDYALWMQEEWYTEWAQTGKYYVMVHQFGRHKVNGEYYISVVYTQE